MAWPRFHSSRAEPQGAKQMAAPAELRTPNMHRAKRIAPRECGWKHGDSGERATKKKLRKQHESRIPLTPTGLLMEGLYDDNPRARELVWIMLANRAARGLASLYVQANQFTLEQAGRFHAEWTPRGWAKSGDSLTAFEQLLYLRQPGYGSCYITGKLLADRLIMEY